MTGAKKRNGALRKRVIDKKRLGGIKTRRAHQKSSMQNNQRRRDVRNAKS
jgi:hypothetical protein